MVHECEENHHYKDNEKICIINTHIKVISKDKTIRMTDITKCTHTDHNGQRKQQHQWIKKVHRVHSTSVSFSVLLGFLHESFKLKPGHQSSSNGLLCFLSSVWVTQYVVQIAEVVSAVDNTQVKNPAMFHNQECQDTNHWSEVCENSCSPDHPVRDWVNV